jgi:hypothetical protein
MESRGIDGAGPVGVVFLIFNFFICLSRMKLYWGLGEGIHCLEMGLRVRIKHLFSCLTLGICRI